MPKKTKREKIRAELRRKQMPAMPNVFTTQLHVGAPQASSFQFQAQQHVATHKPIVIDTTELTIIKADLVKTLILAFIAISTELIIFWLQHR